MDGPRKARLALWAQRPSVDSSFLRSTHGKKGRPKAVTGLIEIAAGDKDTCRRAVWLAEKGALSLEAGLADLKRAHGELAKRFDPEAARHLALAAEALEEG
jgi:hypothetical protein